MRSTITCGAGAGLQSCCDRHTCCLLVNIPIDRADEQYYQARGSEESRRVSYQLKAKVQAQSTVPLDKVAATVFKKVKCKL